MNFYTLNRGLFKRLHIYFSYQSTKIQYRSKIKKWIKSFKSKPLSKRQIKEIREYYSSVGFKNINTNWHRFYTHFSGEFYKEYIPEDLFYNVIIPNLNMNNIHSGLTDKTLIDKLFHNVKQPQNIIKNINGVYYDVKGNNIIEINEVIKICNLFSKLIIKPSIDSGGGKNVKVFNLNNGKTDLNEMTIKELIKSYNNNFVVQKFIKQHEQMSLLNPSSVNTLRINSLLINQKVEILAAVVRIGGIDSRVDNTTEGGIWCHIKAEGLLVEKGYNKRMNDVLETETKIILKDFKIPNYSKIINEIKNLHLQVPYFKFIAWDLAIDDTGDTILIEYNIRAPGIDGQAVNGPTFGKFTTEVLNNCAIN